jgi:zinc transporter 1
MQRTSAGSDGHTLIGSEGSETTPLLKDPKVSSYSTPVDHNGEHAHDHDSRPPSPQKRKPKKKAAHGHAGSMNMQALVLHVLGDALGNVGVIATGLVIWLTSWSFKYYFDPMISLVITVIIFSSALPLGEPF